MKTDSLKFRMDQHANFLWDTVPGRHSTDKMVAQKTDRYSPERISPTERQSRPTKRRTVNYKHNRRKQRVYSHLDCDAGLCAVRCFKDIVYEA
jgi:hypothetical protein